MCQVYHQISKGQIIPLGDAVQLMLDGNADDIVFDSDFVVDSDCSFVAMLSATPSPADTGDGTLFDVTSKQKDVVGKCPSRDFTAAGTMKIVDNPLFETVGAGLTTQLVLSFSGNEIDNSNGGNGGGGGGGEGNGGSNSTNKTLLALTIVFAILAVCAGILLCYLLPKKGETSVEP
eukprot:TRINITY_DN770_c0_g1_i2.p1 TRINITY_DN770_c0_g1~~TRINITY_DN770_c0_g1_i2.p1  ORF type:complete len:176 (-),score=38.64 TRINITY_DN770_c0_g1_i2:109-636(-)